MVSPFPADMWIAVFVTLIVVMIFAAFLTSVLPNSSKNRVIAAALGEYGIIVSQSKFNFV